MLHSHLILLRKKSDPVCPLCEEELNTSLHFLGRCGVTMEWIEEGFWISFSQTLWAKTGTLVYSLIHRCISGMCHYECLAPNVNISLQSERFWAMSNASVTNRLLNFSSCWILPYSLPELQRGFSNLLVTLNYNDVHWAHNASALALNSHLGNKTFGRHDDCTTARTFGNTCSHLDNGY